MASVNAVCFGPEPDERGIKRGMKQRSLDNLEVATVPVGHWQL